MTEIILSFDTEDFTSPDAWDAALREARIMENHGVKGNFNIVGYVAREWARNGRWDVAEALSKHAVGTHSLRHSYHPTINEYTDIESYEKARDLFLEQECEGIGMVKALTGKQSLNFACPPGNNLSYVAMYEYERLGMPVYDGSVFQFYNGRAVHFCNALHLSYDFAMENLFYEDRTFRVHHHTYPYSAEAFLDGVADRRRVVIAHHPTRACHSNFWDCVNYRGENRHPMYEWEPAAKNSSETQKLFYEEFENLIRAVNKDDRFIFTNYDELAEKVRRENAARILTKDRLPEIKARLERRFWNMSLCGDVTNGTYSISDLFAAAAHFCFTDDPFRPGRVRGFLDTPLSASQPAVLTADEVRTLAAAYRPDSFLPTHYRVNGKTLGPAELLFAMLDVAMGANSVTVTPRAQLPTLPFEFKTFEEARFDGSWMSLPDFKDRFLSHRLRLQSWTIREED